MPGKRYRDVPIDLDICPQCHGFMLIEGTWCDSCGGSGLIKIKEIPHEDEEET